MNLFFTKQLKTIELYSLPIAAFFVLISTSAFNTFIILALIIGTFRIVYEKDYNNKISKKFMLYGILIFIFLVLSSYYTISDFENAVITLKKYVKLLYIPILFYYIKFYKNHIIIIKFLISGSMIILLLSYLQFFSILDFSLINKFAGFDLFRTMDKASVFQTSIIHGVVFSLISFITMYLAIKLSKGYVIYPSHSIFNKSKFYFIYSFLCFCNVIWMNDSRNAYIISFFLILLLIIRFFRKKKYAVTTVSLFLVFSLSISEISETIFLKTIKEGYDDITLLKKDGNFSSSIGLRSIWAINGVNNITEKPLFGSGVGSYKSTIKNFLENKNVKVDKNLAISNNPHNEYVSISTQLGMFGLSLYLLFMYSLFKETRRNFLAIGVFIVTFVSSIFNSAFYDNVLGLFIVLSISLFYQKFFSEKRQYD